MKFENDLPACERIDPFITENIDDIHGKISTWTSENDEILSVDAEFESLKTITDFYKASQRLVDSIYEIGENEAMSSVYRSMVFAYQIAKIIHGDEVNSDFPALFAYAERDTPAEDLKRDVEDYFGGNREIEGFVTDYAEDIDEGRGYTDESRITMGAVFMLVEREHAALIELEKLDNVTVENFQ